MSQTDTALEKKEFRVEVEGLFRRKNPRLAKLIPKFVFNWIRKIVHQEEVNYTLTRGAHLRDAAFAELAISDVGATFDSVGKENIPQKGGAIVASNHPLGALDGMALLVEATRLRPDAKFIVNDILMSLPNFEKQFIPVNKLGSNAKESLRRVEETYASGDLVLIFPAGICSRKQNGIIHDLEWNKSFISRAIKHQLPVIPTFIIGKNSKRFYRVARIRRFFGIKANIEMFLLSDEMFRQKGKHLRIIFGKPISYQTFDKSRTAAQWALVMREFVYELELNKDADFIAFNKAFKA